MNRRPSAAPLLWSVLCLAAVPACTSDGTGDATTDETTVGVPIAAATVPPERETPFCEAMIDLNSRLISDPPDDIEAEIIAVYREILPDVPDVLVDDFTAVLTALETGQPLPTTPPPSVSSSDTDTNTDTDADTDTASSVSSVSSVPESDADSLDTTSDTVDDLEDVDEGFDAEPFELSTPAERINDHVRFECRDTGNNPGPPPTEPLEDN